MIDPPSSIDPLVAEGPRVPVATLRPQVIEQRVLLLDPPTPMMVDLAAGNIRLWESGPPVSLPCISRPFDVHGFARLQIQVLRDPRPTSVDTVLFSLDLGSSVVDVLERRDGRLVITATDGTEADGPIGASMAIVLLVESGTDRNELVLSVRNADSVSGPSVRIRSSTATAVLTIGGPSRPQTNGYGRRRLSPVHIDARGHVTPVDAMERIVGIGRRVAHSLKRRVGP